MEDNRKQILSQIEEEISSLKSRLASLEEKVISLSAEIPPQDDGPIDLSAPVTAPAAAPVEEPAPAVEPVEVEPVVDNLPEAEIPEQVGNGVPVVEPEPVVESEPVAVEIPDQVGNDAPAAEPAPVVAEPEPVVEPEPVAEPEPVPAVEAPEAKPKRTRAYKWMTDLPGVPVKNIRSAISLYDRALFINTLFKENYALYDKTISDLNAMASLEEAVSYVEASFPDWNLSSDAVYGFMMAIRKKLG